MGVFREDEEIVVPALIRLWVAEGFLQPDGGRSSEEIAESYLQELVDRNLVSVQERGRKGKILKCKIHDLLRETSLKEGKNRRFFCVLKRGSPWKCRDGSEGCLICSSGIDKTRWLKIVPKFSHHNLEAFFDRFSLRYVDGNLHLDLPRAILKLGSLSLIRAHLSYTHLPSSITLFWNLQTLVISGLFVRIMAPSEIWEMPWLRHVNVFQSIRLPDPPSKHSVMQSLQTLSIVENFMPTEEVCRRIPNITELQIYYNHEAISSSSSKHCQYNLCHLDKLESLKCEFSEESFWHDFALKLTYPSMLQELFLGRSSLYWEDLRMIGSLPNLEVLVLGFANSVKGEEWSPTEGEFLRLKSLKTSWNAEPSHFPVLKTLSLGYAYKLFEFPSEIGEIPTLRCVALDRCIESASICNENVGGARGARERGPST